MHRWLIGLFILAVIIVIIVLSTTGGKDDDNSGGDGGGSGGGGGGGRGSDGGGAGDDAGVGVRVIERQMPRGCTFRRQRHDLLVRRLPDLAHERHQCIIELVLLPR